MQEQRQVFRRREPYRQSAARPLMDGDQARLSRPLPALRRRPPVPSFLKTVDRCEHCGEEMHHHRADDLPAYLVVVIVGHIIVGAFMGVEATSTLSTWQHLAIWVPLTIVFGACAATAGQGRCRGTAMGALYAWLRRRSRHVESHPEA